MFTFGATGKPFIRRVFSPLTLFRNSVGWKNSILLPSASRSKVRLTCGRKYGWVANSTGGGRETLNPRQFPGANGPTMFVPNN